MATVSTVGPGKDYAVLQGWEDAVDGLASNAQDASCYSGSDLGELYISGWGGGHVEGNSPRVYPATGEEHDGDPTNTTQGARIEADGATGIHAWPYIHWFEVSRMRINCDLTGGPYFGINLDLCNYCTVDGNLIVITNAGSNGYIGIAAITIDDAVTNIRNNIVVCDEDGTAYTQWGIRAQGRGNSAGTFDSKFNIDNNTILGISKLHSTYTGGIQMCSYCNTGSTLNLEFELRNNLCVEKTVGASGSCYRDGTGSGPGTVNLTFDLAYNLSTDATADDWGGVGNIIDQAPADVVVDPATFTDVSLVDSGPGDGTGEDLSGEFTTDAIGNIHGDAGAWDMGALAMLAPEPSSSSDPEGSSSSSSDPGGSSSSSSDPSVEQYVVVESSIEGSLIFDDGYNTEIVISEADNAITVRAAVGAGLGQPCNWESQGEPMCGDLIVSINGVTAAANRTFIFSGGPGVEVVPYDDNTLIVRIGSVSDMFCIPESSSSVPA